MTYLQILLFSILDTEEESSMDYQIAKYLLLNADHLSGSSLSDIAADCHVSKASISRFCRRIGLQDYMDLQMLIRGNSLVQENHPVYALSLQECSVNYMLLVGQAQQEINRAILNPYTAELIQDLLHYENIACFGHLQAGNVATELRHNLSRIQKLAYYSPSLNAQEAYFDDADDSHLILIFSATGRYFQRFAFNKKKLLRQNKPKIYLITTTKLQNSLPYVDRVIELASSYDDNKSHLLMFGYANYLSYSFQNLKQ